MQREAKISNYFLAGYCSLCLIFLSLPLSEPVRALKAAVIYSMDPEIFAGEKSQERLAGLPARLRRLISADEDNNALRLEIRDSLWLKDQLHETALENAQLNRLLGLKTPPDKNLIWVHVMERDPVNWYHSVMVDAGADKGVTPNAPVLGSSGANLAAVGRIVEVRPRSSVVLLLTDEFSSAAADISSGTVEGLIQGEGGESLLLNYLPQTAQPRIGEIVYTAPTSAVFPPSIPIGVVSKIRPEDPFLAFKSAEVRPSVEAASLSLMAILLPRRLKESAQ
ncbi:MAG: rod shape-determining protein MreC [Elusimicrobiota bacterium]